MDGEYMAYEQENSIRDGQVIIDEQMEEELRMEEEEMRMMEQDDLIWNGRLILNEMMEGESRVVEEDTRMMEAESMIMEEENLIRDGQSVMDENEVMEDESVIAKEQMRIDEEQSMMMEEGMRIKEQEQMLMKEKLRMTEEESTMTEKKRMMAKGLLDDEKSISSMGEPQNEFTQIYEEWMMRREKQRMEEEQSRREQKRGTMAETSLWRSKELMMDELLMTRTRESVMTDAAWPVMNEEPIMDEVWRMRAQSINNEKSIMNEEWRMIVDEMMDKEGRFIVHEMLEEELMDEEIERSMIVNEMMDEEFLMNEELMMDEVYEEARTYHHDTWNEDTLDYEQSIMDEMMGWHLTGPVMEKQQSTFGYSALDQPEHKIRVVRLHSRRWQTDPRIVCDIITLDLRKGPWYEALSYEWSSPSTSKGYTIRLNNKSIVVRQNLWWALYELRHAHQSRTLWIDAICINQFDVHERNCQVSRMGDIYSQAARVVAWIGQANHESGHAFLSQLTISAERFFRSGGACPRWQHRCKWQALGSLCSRSYWSRLWIIQEVLLASELHIQCGSLSFRWEELSNVFHHLRQNSTAFCPSWTKLSVISSVPFRLDMQRKKHQMAVLAHNDDDLMPLLDLVDLFKNASCFDDRDKIFGLRSLSLPCCKYAVKTDYSMDHEGVINTLLAHHEAKHP